MKRCALLMSAAGFFLLGGCAGVAGTAGNDQPSLAPVAAVKPSLAYAGTRVAWRALNRQPDAWYGSDDALGLAVNVIGYQTASGGWPKNLDMTVPVDKATRGEDPGYYLSNIDNDSTITQVEFLARILAARDDAYVRAAFNRGFDYLLAAQYANGGWPQYYPLRPGYYTHITFNDNAMVNVLSLLRDASEGRGYYAFVDAARRARAAAAVQKGIACILNCQILVNGQPTVWCAQHNEVTLAPAPARAYELASFSGQESVGITRFLMAIPNPSPKVIASIRGAVAWFKQAQLNGIRVQTVAGNRVVVADPNAPPLWARFYDLDTGKPFFCGRDGIKKENMADIEAERRNGYSWYGSGPASLLSTDYPAWEKRIASASPSPQS